MKKYLQISISILIFIGLLITIFLLPNNLTKELDINSNNDLLTPKVLTEEEKIAIFIEENNKLIEFYANVFQINIDTLIEEIKMNKDNYKLNNEEFETSLIDNLLSLEKEKNELFDKKITGNTKSKEYIVSLIKYYTSIYPSVDFEIAASIGLIESGYRSKYMMSVNNFFGGMSNGKLISYKNIEYGTLKYILLLKNGYFDKGLNTVEKIGRVYNPTYNENGVKIASPKWVINVNNTLDKWEDYKKDITLEDVLSLQ